MANRDYIERLRQVIIHLHKATPTHKASVPVHEQFRGKTIWRGVVEVFEVKDHPKAKTCYAWSHLDGDDDSGERIVTVLGILPVVSPETAVKVAAASEIKSKRIDRKK